MITSESKPEKKPINQREKNISWVEFILTALVLLGVSVTVYTNLILGPDLGFAVNLNTGELSSLKTHAEQFLNKTDIIVKVNDVPITEINKNFQDNPFIQTGEGEILNLTILRNGTVIQVAYPVPRQSTSLATEIITSDWILPIPFFAAGLITTLFIRPRTKTRFLFILFFYSYAIWISAGTISDTGYWHASLIMKVFVWLSIPITLQLHWYFPKPFISMKKWIILAFYGACILCGILEFLGVMPSNYYFTGFLFSLISSLVILVIKFFRFKEIRRIMRLLLTAYLLALSPLVIMIILSIIGIASPPTNIALIGLPAIPGFYFFSAYQFHLNRKARNVDITMKFYTIGILVVFVLNFIVLFLPREFDHPLILNSFSFMIIIFIMLTGFGILLIMPALANDQTNLFHSEAYTLRLSANKTAAFINYLLVLSPLIFLVILVYPGSRTLPFDIIILIIASNLVFAGLTVMVYQKYKTLFERVVLGIKHPPEELIRNYAHRITTSLDIHDLADLLKKEVLPSLLIRESALFYFAGRSRVRKLFSSGIKTGDQEIRNFLTTTLSFSGPGFQETFRTAFPWAHFILPLQIKSDVLGIWIFGRKDPDDIYDQELIEDLKSLGNQTTLALLNIRQAALLQSLYKSNVTRQEEQKAIVARDLHDVLLPSISCLVELQNNNCDLLEFEDAVQRVNNMVREIMSGLRPSSLDMGLNIALEELADEPEAQIGGKLNIQTDLKTPNTPVDYDKDVELHLYRMVQQACRNALEHAQANTVHIKGTLAENSIDLVVEDDGVGFPLNGLPDLGQLISDRHFGLANIVERAKIIHADLEFNSQPNQGTKIHFRWPADDKIG